jgi:hypothetical protein
MDYRNLEETPDTNLEYERPRVVDFGDLVQLTQGSNSGCFTDVDFPRHTPEGDLTFSC